jgi:hypothetical protein
MTRKAGPIDDEVAREALQKWADERALKLIRIEEEVLRVWQKVLAERNNSRPELKVTHLPGSTRLSAVARHGKPGRPTPLCFIRETEAGRYHVRMGDGAEFDCGLRMQAGARAQIYTSLCTQAAKLARPERTLPARRSDPSRSTRA